LDKGSGLVLILIWQVRQNMM